TPLAGNAATGTARTPLTGNRPGFVCLVLALVDQLIGSDPGHHGTQLGANLLNLRFGVDAATGSQRGSARSMLQDKALGIFAGLDVLQALTHCGTGFVGHDTGAGHVLTILRIVRDGVVHVGNATFVDEVDDQLQFVQALEVSHLGRITCLHQGVEAGLDEFHGTAAQNSLFTEQVSFRFFAEGGFDDAGTAAANGAGVGKADVASGTGLVLMHGHQCRYTAALVVGAAHGVTRSLRSHHDDVDVITRLNLAVMDVEAVCESEHSARLDVGGNVVTVDLSDVLVRQQNHDQVGGFDRVGNFLNFQAGVFGLGPGCTTFAQTHHHVHAGVVQVECVCVALRTVADDG